MLQQRRVALGAHELQHDDSQLGGQAHLQAWASATTFEASSFGDPSRHNAVRNHAGRAVYPLCSQTTAAPGSSARATQLLVLLGDYAAPGWWMPPTHTTTTTSMRFRQQTTMASRIRVPIATQLPEPQIESGLGAYEPSKNNTYSIAANTSKIVRLFRSAHVLCVGYAYDHTNFLDQPSRSGALFPNSRRRMRQDRH